MQDFSKAEVSRNHNNSFKASVKSALEFIDKLSTEYQTNREELEVLRKERAAIIENLIQILKTNKIKIDKPLGKCNNSELNEELIKVINDMDFIERESFQCDLIKINNRYAKIMELGRKLDELSFQLGTIHIPEADYDDELVIDFGTPIKPYNVDKYDVSEEVISNNDIIVDSSIYIQEEPVTLEEEIIRDINPDTIISDHIDEQIIDVVNDDFINEEEIIKNEISESIQSLDSDVTEKELEITNVIPTEEIQEISIDEPDLTSDDDSIEETIEREFEEVDAISTIPYIIEEKTLIEKIVDKENEIIDSILPQVEEIAEVVEEETKEEIDDNDLINRYLDSIQITDEDENKEPVIEEEIKTSTVEEENEDFLFYEITNNVTLEEIAESVYEDGKLWKELYNYDVNKDIIDKLAKSKKKSAKDICLTPGDLNNIKLKFPVELITYEEIIVDK